MALCCTLAGTIKDFSRSFMWTHAKSQYRKRVEGQPADFEKLIDLVTVSWRSWTIQGRMPIRTCSEKRRSFLALTAG